jgi:hypothetical protein
MYDISQIMESRQLSPDYLQNLLNIKKNGVVQPHQWREAVEY